MGFQASIYAFDWSDEIIEKLGKHNVDYWEVEEVIFEDPQMVLKRVCDEKHGERWLVQGRTMGGRKLRIFLKPCENREGIWFVITAWEEGK